MSFEPGVTNLPPQHLQETLRTTESKSQKKAVERVQRSARVAAGKSFRQQASASSPLDESLGLQDYNLEHALTGHLGSDKHQHKQDNQSTDVHNSNQSTAALDDLHRDSDQSTEALDSLDRAVERYIEDDWQYLEENNWGYPSSDLARQSARLSYLNIRNPDVDPPSSR